MIISHWLSNSMQEPHWQLIPCVSHEFILSSSETVVSPAEVQAGFRTSLLTYSPWPFKRGSSLIAKTVLRNKLTVSKSPSSPNALSSSHMNFASFLRNESLGVRQPLCLFIPSSPRKGAINPQALGRKWMHLLSAVFSSNFPVGAIQLCFCESKSTRKGENSVYRSA